MGYSNVSDRLSASEKICKNKRIYGLSQVFSYNRFRRFFTDKTFGHNLKNMLDKAPLSCVYCF